MLPIASFGIPIFQKEPNQRFQCLYVGGLTMSVHDRSPTLAVSPDGLRCQSRHPKEWHGCRASRGAAGKGRFYYEAMVEDEGLCRLGFSTPEVFFCYVY